MREIRILARPLVLSAALLLAGAGASWAGPTRYLVMPFENLSSEPSLNWLGEALSASLGARLEILGMRTADRSEREDALDDLSLPSNTPLTLATMLRVAAHVRAGRLIAGTFNYDQANGVVVTARLVDIRGMRVIWDGSRQGSLAEIFKLMDPLVESAAVTDNQRLSPAPMGAMTSMEDPPLPLYEVIVRAQSEPDADARTLALERALDHHPRSTPMLRALAFSEAESGKTDKALRLIGRIPEANKKHDWRLDLLEARLLFSERKNPEAMEAASRSIAAGENAGAHVLMARLLAAHGDKDRASAELDLAAGLDPGHPEIPEIRSLLAQGSP